MSSYVTAAQIFGTLGAVCWSVQLLPQIWTNYKRGHTHGLQPLMMLLWSAAGIPLGVYNIVRSFPIALQIQPQILTVLSLITWAQTQYYPPAREKRARGKAWCALTCATICTGAAGIESAFVFGLRAAVKGKESGQIEYHPAIMTMGVLAAVLLCAGVASHYIDIWKEKTVRGISFLFVGIDALGDLTSLISVLFWWKAGQTLDILGLIVYGSEFVLWSGVLLCGIKYNLVPVLAKRVNVEQDLVQHHRTPPAVDTIESESYVLSEFSSSAFRTASRDESCRHSVPREAQEDGLRMRYIAGH